MSDKSKAIHELLDDLDAVIGRGQCGIVYALKSTPDEAVKEIELDGATPDLEEAVETELQAMQFFRHPNLLEYRQVLRDREVFYLRMRRYKSSLEQKIRSFRRRRTSIPEANVLDILRQVSSALAYLHAPDSRDPDGRPLPPVIMRYLQPSQILIDDDTHCVLSDFCVPKDKFSNRASFEVASAYAAPEGLQAGTYTPASDMWSVGCILYELLTMKAPAFTRDAGKDGVFPEKWEPDLDGVESKIGRELVKRLLVVDPRGRLSAAQLVSLLDSDGKQEGVLGTLRLEHLEMLCANYGRELVALREYCQRQELEMRELRERLQTLEGHQRPCAGVSTVAKLNLLGSEKEASPAQVNTPGGEQLRLLETAPACQAHPGHMLLNQLLDPLQVSYPAAAADGAPDADGLTGLMRAAYNGDVEAAERLVAQEKGMQDRNGWTALMIALMQRHVGVALLLARHEEGICDSTGKTALMWAAQTGDAEVAMVLVPREKGMQDILGQTALMWAAKNGNVDVARLLLAHEQRMRDSKGETALLKAVHWGHTAVVQLLAPAERDLRSRRGRTALDHAREEARPDVVALLS